MTKEYTYDAKILQKFYEDRIKEHSGIELALGIRISRIVREQEVFRVILEDGSVYEAPFVLNATYASVNQVIDKTEGVEKAAFPIKYELCEIILCQPEETLKKTGITVMDGPFFSIMPFGRTGYHSLTSVTFTPHMTSYEDKPVFACQEGVSCSPENLGNCSQCVNRPESAWPYMSHLADKYLRPEYRYTYLKSLYSMKPILKSSEVDDSRPTAIRALSTDPTFISVLSGKINTVYDLDSYLE